MGWLKRIIVLLRNSALGREMTDAMARNSAASERLDAAVKEVLRK